MTEPPIYVNFYAKPIEDEVRYKIASFERVPAYIDGSTTTTLDPPVPHEYHSAQNISIARSMIFFLFPYSPDTHQYE